MLRATPESVVSHVHSPFLNERFLLVSTFAENVSCVKVKPYRVTR
jgi:hypothetical protein